MGSIQQIYLPGGGGLQDTLVGVAAGLSVVDALATPTDLSTQALRAMYAETQATPTDIVGVGLSGYGEALTAPTDSRTSKVQVWLSGTTGAGVTNPGNANGQNDGLLATLQTAPAGAATITMTSALGANLPSGLTLTSVIYRGWFKSMNTLVTSIEVIQVQSTSALFSNFNMFLNNAAITTVDHLSGDFTFDLLAAGVNTLAKLQSVQIAHASQDAAAGVSPGTMTVDAGCLEISGAF